jgi:hypothetical protein
MFSEKDKVRIWTPDNPTLHGREATVKKVTEWGAHLSFYRDPYTNPNPPHELRFPEGKGSYRATFDEMIPMEDQPILVPNQSQLDTVHEYTGEVCTCCQGSRMVRTGKCSTCLDCGETGGCS